LVFYQPELMHSFDQSSWRPFWYTHARVCVKLACLSFLQVHRLSTDFRAATRIVTEGLPMAAGVPPGHVLVRRAYAGVNASDVNYTAGRYFGGGRAAEARLPFDAGFESVGVVAAVGPGVAGTQLGKAVPAYHSSHSLL
jgi:hypothetical protein